MLMEYLAEATMAERRAELERCLLGQRARAERAPGARANWWTQRRAGGPKKAWQASEVDTHPQTLKS